MLKPNYKERIIRKTAYLVFFFQVIKYELISKIFHVTYTIEMIQYVTVGFYILRLI